MFFMLQLVRITVHDRSICNAQRRVSAINVYEYLITLDQEVVMVWKKKRNTSSLILLGVRWILFSSAVLNIMHFQQEVSLQIIISLVAC